MSDPIVQLEFCPALGRPGRQVRTPVTVRNLGTIVEGFRLEVPGEGRSVHTPTELSRELAGRSGLDRLLGGSGHDPASRQQRGEPLVGRDRPRRRWPR